MRTASIRSSVLSFALAAAVAQSPFTSVSLTSAGPSCNLQPTGCCAVVSAPTEMFATLDTTQSVLRLAVPAVVGCCGVAVPVRLLAIGTAPAVIPLPQFGLGCTLWLQPVAVLALVGSDTFVLPIPSTLQPLTFLAQAAAVHTQTFGPTVVTLSAAESIALQ
jgi:hypothetical protein